MNGPTPLELGLLGAAVVSHGAFLLLYQRVVRPVVPESERYTPGSWPGIREAARAYRTHCEGGGASLWWWRWLWLTLLGGPLGFGAMLTSITVRVLTPA